MSKIKRENLQPKWSRRMGYRLRRANYRMTELEAPAPARPVEAAHAHHHAHHGVHRVDHAARHETEKAVESLREQLLRSRADFENFRKRMKREEQQRMQMANQRLVEQLLPVLDNLGRATQNPGETVVHLLGGIEMVHKQFEDVLIQQGLEKIEPQGQPFDPNLHEAVGVVTDSDLPDNTIAEVFHPGYTLKGRLVRPAMVRVARSE